MRPCVGGGNPTAGRTTLSSDARRRLQAVSGGRATAASGGGTRARRHGLQEKIVSQEPGLGAGLVFVRGPA